MVGGGALAVLGGLQADRMSRPILFLNTLGHLCIIDLFNTAGRKVSIAISITVYALLAILSVLGYKASPLDTAALLTSSRFQFHWCCRTTPALDQNLLWNAVSPPNFQHSHGRIRTVPSLPRLFKLFPRLSSIQGSLGLAKPDQDLQRWNQDCQRGDRDAVHRLVVVRNMCVVACSSSVNAFWNEVSFVRLPGGCIIVSNYSKQLAEEKSVQGVVKDTEAW